MSNNTTRPFLKKKCMLLIFLALLCFSVFENAFSRQSWSKDFVTLTYDETENSISVKLQIFDYEFGPNAEHGYLKWCTFIYTLDGKSYNNFMRCEVEDQSKNYTTTVKLNNKLANAKIQFIDCAFPVTGSFWPENTNCKINVFNVKNKAYLTIKWLVPEDIKIIDIILMGKWYVNGISCHDDIFTVKYPVQNNTYLKLEGITHSFKKMDLYRRYIDLKLNDEIVINGLEGGQGFNDYSVSGTPVDAITTNKELIKFKLPANQIYIDHVGQSHYNVAL